MNRSRDRRRCCWPAVGLLAVAALAAAAFAVTWWLPRNHERAIQFGDVTGRAGVTFHHTDGSSGRKYIVENITGGLATFDSDGDGLIDIYFLNGKPLKGTPTSPEEPKNRLFRNLGAFRFADVTDEAGVGDTGHGLGVCAGDYDSDGHPDLYVANYGPKVLYHNNGDGTFTEVTQRAGVADGSKVGAGACFVDTDANGELDLYVANYIDFTYENHVVRMVGGLALYASPLDYRPMQHTLYRNKGDGTFTDVSETSGVAAHPSTGMGMICADYDNDGDTDVFVLNDVFGNSCFQNDGRGRFEEVSLFNGFKFNGNGMELGSMGVDAADYDNDGWLDLYQTTYDREWPVLFRNLGNGNFEDVTAAAGAGQGLFTNVKWGCGFADMDNDGHKDLFVGVGHLQDNLHGILADYAYEACPVLLRNTGDGTFVNISDAAGDGMKVKAVARGVALDDLDNDGRVDVVILSSRRPAIILRNETTNRNHWVQLSLRGVKTNRDGVGARVKVVAGKLVQIDEVHSGRGYQSHFGSRLHFGLGTHARIDRIEVHWLGGGLDVLEDVAADRLLAIQEGSSAVSRGPVTP